jgi:hypothetical protein
MNTKTLFIHAGGTKTGSSAIQNFLRSVSTKLRTLGYSYRDEYSAPGASPIGSGNAEGLVPLLTKPSRNLESDARLEAALLSYFYEETGCAICSSELLSAVPTDGWRDLLKAATKLELQVFVCFYVRNVSAFLLSAYDQGLKRHGLRDDWVDYVSGVSDWEHYTTLRRLDEAFPRSHLRVLSYDRSKETLIDSFLGILDLAEHFDAAERKSATETIINRSLTTTEREILRAVNAISSALYCTRISDAFLQSDPNARPQPTACDTDILANLERKFRAQTEWINDTFFDGENVVRISSDSAQPPSVASTDSALASYRVALAVLVDALARCRNDVAAQCRDEIIVNIVDQLRSIDWENASQPSIPEDFDPFMYLFCNADLLVAGAKPFSHYIEYGHRERRSWTVE